MDDCSCIFVLPVEPVNYDLSVPIIVQSDSSHCGLRWPRLRILVYTNVHASIFAGAPLRILDLRMEDVVGPLSPSCRWEGWGWLTVTARLRANHCRRMRVCFWLIYMFYHRWAPIINDFRGPVHSRAVELIQVLPPSYVYMQ